MKTYVVQIVSMTSLSILCCVIWDVEFSDLFGKCLIATTLYNTCILIERFKESAGTSTPEEDCNQAYDL